MPKVLLHMIPTASFCCDLRVRGFRMSEPRYQWGAGQSVPDCGPEPGLKIRSPKSGLARGGASGFFMPRALNQGRLHHLIIDVNSHG
jgi:hypothetical protein